MILFTLCIMSAPHIGFEGDDTVALHLDFILVDLESECILVDAN